MTHSTPFAINTPTVIMNGVGTRCASVGVQLSGSPIHAPPLQPHNSIRCGGSTLRQRVALCNSETSPGEIWTYTELENVADCLECLLPITARLWCPTSTVCMHGPSLFVGFFPRSCAPASCKKIKINFTIYYSISTLKKLIPAHTNLYSDYTTTNKLIISNF
jgi:hypothetical protein